MAQRQLFFSLPEQFEHLQRRLLPALVDHARSGHRVRIWSLGCGHGEEAFSIAMTILDVAPDARGLDIRVLATDDNADALQHARTATYEAAGTRGIPELFKARWMEPVRGLSAPSLRFDPSVRDLVVFEQAVIGQAFRAKGYFNAIFCRSVQAGLDDHKRAQLWASLMPHLAPGGMLYTGSSDIITGPALGNLRMAGVSTYMRLAA